MKGSIRAAAAIGIGYVLGRHRKFRTAAVMAAGMTVGGTTVGNLALKRGMKMLGSTEAIQKVAPQLGDLADTVRGDLVAAGKAAATAAVANRVDALTDTLHDHADRLRNPADTVAEGTEEAAEAGRTAARAGGRAAAGTARRASDSAGGTTRRLSGRGRAADAEEDEAEVDEAEVDEAEVDEAEVDDDFEPDDHEDDEYEDDDQPDEAVEAPPRPADGHAPPVPGRPCEEVSDMARAENNGPVDRLKAEAGSLAGALAERAMSSVRDRVESATGRLTDYAEGDGGPGLTAAVTGAKSMAEGKSPGRSMFSAGGAGLKEKVSGAFGRGKGKSGGKSKLKLTNIVESIEVGVPLPLAYNQWTTYHDFPTFTKKVENADPRRREQEGQLEGAGLLVAPGVGGRDPRSAARRAHHLAVQGPEGPCRRGGNVPRTGSQPDQDRRGPRVPPAGHVRADRQPLAGPGPARPA